MAKTFNGSPAFENLWLDDLFPTSRSGLQLVASGGDEELFRTTAKMVVELQDYGGTNPFEVTGVLADECPSLVGKHGKRAHRGDGEAHMRFRDSNSFKLIPVPVRQS